LRTLFAGPYTGEFGWELCCWNPRLRRYAREFDRVIACGPASSRYLYEFADAYLDIEVLPGTSDFMHGTLSSPVPSLPVSPGEKIEMLQPPWEWCRQELMNFRRPFPGSEDEKVWRDLTPALDGAPPIAEVCLAFRPPKLFNGKLYEDKAWPRDRCEALDRLLRAAGLRVVYVGGKDNYCFGDRPHEDVRDLSLQDQCAVLAEASVTVGPSSAPLHLSQLCRTGVVTWYARPKSESEGRYESWWNPFQAPHHFVGYTQPSVEEVYAATMGLLE
jgi:hypothetical protein